MHQLTRFDFTGPNGGGGGSLATKSCLTHATLGTYQVPLSMRFSRQGYWGGLPFPSPEDLPNQELNPGLLHCRWILSWLSHKGSPRILEWVAYPFPSRSSWPRNQTGVSCIAGRFFSSWATRETQEYWNEYPIPSPADCPYPEIKPGSPALQADSLLLCHQEQVKIIQLCLTLFNPTD